MRWSGRDPDPDSQFGSADPFESGSETWFQDQDPGRVQISGATMQIQSGYFLGRNMTSLKRILSCFIQGTVWCLRWINLGLVPFSLLSKRPSSVTFWSTI